MCEMIKIYCKKQKEWVDLHSAQLLNSFEDTLSFHCSPAPSEVCGLQQYLAQDVCITRN